MGTFQVPGRISGKTYNLKIKGDTPSDTEQARIRAFVEEKENSFAADYEARYGAPLTVDDGTALGRGFELGKAGAYSRLGTATEYLGSGLGLESVADFGRGMRESGDQETFLETLRQPAPTQLEDVKGLGSFLTYAGEGIGQSGPEMLAPLAVTGIGTLAGTAATGNPFTGAAIGVGAGAVTAFPSFFGGNIQRQEEEVAAGRKDKVDVTDAVISAVGQSALNSITDKLLLGGFLKPGQKWLTRTAVGAGEGAAAEIPTEITQQIIERKQAGLPLDDDEAINEYINAGDLGGIMGGGIRGATAGLGIGVKKETPPPPLLLPPPALITPPPGTPPSAPSGAPPATSTDAPNVEDIPDEAYAEDAKAGAGTYTQEDLADVAGVYDEILANEKAKGTNPDAAERIAASSTLDYLDTLPEDVKQRLSQYRANLVRFASIPDSLPDEAYSEFSAPEPDLFNATRVKPTVTLDAKPAAATGIITDPEAFEQADTEAAAAGTGVAARLKAINDEAAKKQAEIDEAARKQAEAAATLKAQADEAARKQAEAVKPAQVLTDELVTKMGIKTAKSATLRRLVGKPLTDTKVINALDRWAQNGNAPAEGAALAARLIGRPDLFGAPQAEAPVKEPQAAPTAAPTAAPITDIAGAWDAQNRNNRSNAWFEGNVTTSKAFDAVQKDGNFIPAHGMSKVATLSEGLKQLTTMLDGGIDPNRTLYTAPLTAVPGSSSTTPGGYAYRDGPFIVTFRQGLAGPPTSADITGVLVNPAHAEIATELQTKYPNLTIRTFDAVADVVAASKSAAPTGSLEKYGVGWKLHLNPVPGSEQVISDYLSEKKIPHKVGRASGQEGKGITVYAGSRDDANALAADINSRFSGVLNDAEGDVLTDDTQIAGKVWGRFDLPKNAEFHQYGAAGIPFLNVDMAQLRYAENKDAAIESAKKTADGILQRRYGAYYTGTKPAQPTQEAAPQISGTFKTAKGSTYDLFEDGSTKRNKAARNDPGHEGDFGEKQRSLKTIYLKDKAGAQNLTAAGLENLGQKGARVILRDNKASMITWNDRAGKWGRSPSSTDIPFSTTPQVGYFPLELWQAKSDVGDYEAYSGMHAGNAIVELQAAPQATAQGVENDGEGAAVDPAKAGTSAPGGTQGVGEGQGAASDGQAAEISTTSRTGGLAGNMQPAVAAGATGGTEPNTLAELEAQLAAARAEAEVARKKVPPGLLERKPVGGAVDPALQKAVTNLKTVLARQEKALEKAKNAFNLAKVPGEVRTKRLAAYTDAIAKVDATRKQLAEAQALLSSAGLKAELSRGVQPLAQPDAKGQVALTNYTKALNKADALAKRIETARARQVEEAQAPVLPTGLRDPVVPDTFMTFQRGFTTKPIAPADAPRSAAESVLAENILRRLTKDYLARTTEAYRRFTGGRRGINSESSWETNPDWVPLDDQKKVLNLLGRVDVLQEFDIAKDELEPGEVLLTKEERAARVYFSKTIRPVDAIAMMVQDLTVGYKKYRVSEDVVTIKGIGNVESLLSQGTGSVPATDALNWVRANLSVKTNGAVDLSVKKQAEKNKTLEGFVGAEGGTDRVEEQRAKRRAVKAAQAADADTSGYSAMETAAQMAAGDSRIALDQGLHYSVKASLDNGDLKGALLALAATTNNAELKTLASRFAELTGTTRVKVLYPGDSARNIGRNAGIYWQYDGNNLNDLERRNIIYLNGQIGMTAHTLTHEVAHALSSSFIETQPNHPVVKQLEELLVMLRNKVSVRVAGAPGDFYGLRNVKELVAEAYGRIALGETDNGLRDLMKNVVLTTEIAIEFDIPLTAWERFKEIAANILNVVMGRPLTKRPRAKRKDTVLKYETATEKFHRLFDGILSEASDVLPDSVLQKAVSSPMVAKNVLNNAIKNAPIWDSAGRKRLSDLMMSSVSVDLRRALLAPLQLEWFNDIAGKYFPQIAALKVIDDLRRGNIRRLEQASAPVLGELAKYAQQNPELYSALMSILPTASRLEVDPTKPQSTYASDPEKLRVWHDLNRQLNTLDTTGEMRKLFKTNIALFASYRKEILDVLRARVKDLTDDVAMQNQIYKRLMDKLDAEGAIDPYFSLMREGDFWLIYTAEDNTAGVVALDPFGRPKRPTTQYIQAFNSAWARSAFRAKLETTKDADGKPVAWDIKEDRRPKQDRNLRGSVSPAIVQAMFNILDSTVPKTTRDAAAEQRAANARTAIEDLFLSFAPETSILKSLNKRKGTRGFIGDITPIGVVDRPLDMLGALDRKSHAIAFQLSNMKYGAEIQRLMTQVVETHNKLKDSGLSSGESVAVEAYRDEFLARAAYAKSPTISKFWQTNRGLTFGFTLGGNISGMVNSLFQIPAIGVPELAGRYGMREAQRELRFAASAVMHAGKTQQVLSYGPDGRAVRELTSIDNYGSLGNYYTPKVKNNPQTGEEEFGYDLRTDMNIPAKLQAKLKDMDVLVEVMANNDMLAGSTNQELLDATSDWWRKINRWSGFGLHHAERFNRQTMAVAAYNLELGKRAAGSAAPDYATKLAAAKKAVEITERVNGGIGAAQGAPIGFGGIGSLVMMYKRFGLMMTRYLINNVKQSLKRVKPGMSPAEIAELKAERAVARYQTIGIIGAAALFSGAQGLPFFGEVTTLIDLFLTDDDEEPTKVVIQKFLGEPYYNGALNYLLGIEIASRISLSGLIFRENMIDKDQPILYDAIEMFGGPAVGVILNLNRGYDLMQEGELYRGLEAMTPSAIKNLMKAGRFGFEGATTLRGDEIVPLSVLDLFKQGIGYTPEAYARQQQRTSVTKRIDEAVREKRSKLLRKYNTAIEARDFAEVREILKDMREFSREYPDSAIEDSTLSRSLKGFQQRSDEMIGGVSFNQLERARREIGEFDEDTTLWADITQ